MSRPARAPLVASGVTAGGVSAHDVILRPPVGPLAAGRLPAVRDLAVCAGCLRVASLAQLMGHRCPGVERGWLAELCDRDRLTVPEGAQRP